MHKMIRTDSRIISRRYNRLMPALNLPSLAAAAVLLVFSLLIIPNLSVSSEIYVIFFKVLYIACAYSFAVTFIIALIANRKINGHRKYSYIEILEQELVVSEYAGTANINGKKVDYCRRWVMKLSDVSEIICGRKTIRIKGRARAMEQRADWLCYSDDGNGKAVFDYWWYNEGGSKEVNEIEIKDNYLYAERAAQRILFCSEKQKVREIKRAEFRRRMLEIAGSKKQRRKKKERVFRGYEIERKF